MQILIQLAAGPAVSWASMRLDEACVVALWWMVICAAPAAGGGNASSRGEFRAALVGFREAEALKWLHIPKAGLSFKNSLYRLACPSLPWDAVVRPKPGKFDVHFDYAKCGRQATRLPCVRRLYPFISHPPLTPYDRAAPFLVVAMFRSPSQRLISAFYADNSAGGRHAVGMRDAVRESVVDGVRFNETNLTQYAAWPGVAGCACHMLTGHHCARDDACDVEAAVSLVPRLGFVGLTDRWDDSIVLLHAQLGLGPPAPAQLLNTHPGTLEHGAHGYDESLLQGFRDADDERVYAAATDAFDARSRAHDAAIAALTKQMAAGPSAAVNASEPAAHRFFCCANASGVAQYERRRRRA